MMSNYSDILTTYFGPVISMLTIIGNLIEIYTIFESRGKNKPLAVSMMFFLNMSMSHLFIGIISTVLHLVCHISDPKHFLLTGFFFKLALYVNVLSLIILTFIRMYAVTKPITYRRITRKITFRVCVITWIVSMLIAASGFCSFRYGGRRKFRDVFFPILIYPAIILCIVAFYRLQRQLKKQCKFRSKHSAYCPSKKAISALVKTVAAQSNMDSCRRRVKAEVAGYKARMKTIFEINLVKLTGSTIILFLICWFPMPTFSIAEMFDRVNEWRYTTFVRISLLELALCNSLLNPVVYFIHMRSQIKKQIRYRAKIISKYFKNKNNHEDKFTELEKVNDLIKVAVLPIFNRYKK